MRTSSRTILVGEDELEVRGYLEMALKCLGHRVELAQDGEEVLAYLRNARSEVGVVLLDVAMPRKNGLDTLREIRAMDATMPVIMISGLSSTMNVVNAMKNGATDFLPKPVAHEDLRTAISRAIASREIDLPIPPKNPNGQRGTFESSNPRMKAIESLIAQIGSSEAPVLIQGETGSGKEVLARQFHANSPRAGKGFLKLNCAALPSELVESELFGYERGAFTGAFQKKAGMFELANGGTILLDEIGDMDVRLQAKLLQVLQDYEFQRIGGKETVRVDVRVIAATHRDLQRSIADGSFREDLYYRLNVINVQLPPLRDRREDIIPLAEYFIHKHAPKLSSTAPALSMELKHALTVYHWPGNVRELENVMRRFLVMPESDTLISELHAKATRKALAPTPLGNMPVASTLPARPKTPECEPSSILTTVNLVKQEAEKDAILTALISTRWNRKQAAVLLNIDYKALLYKMKKLGVDGKLGADRVEHDSTENLTMHA